MPKRKKPPTTLLERPLEAIQARANHLLWLTIENVAEALWAASQQKSDASFFELVSLLSVLVQTAQDMPVQTQRRPSLIISFEGINGLPELKEKAGPDSLPNALGEPPVHNR